MTIPPGAVKANACSCGRTPFRTVKVTEYSTTEILCWPSSFCPGCGDALYIVDGEGYVLRRKTVEEALRYVRVVWGVDREAISGAELYRLYDAAAAVLGLPEREAGKEQG